MDSPTLLRTAFADLHSELVDDVRGLSTDELFAQPAPGVNHIGFLLWHIVRDEDSVICQAVLGRPEIWRTAGWAERFGMDEREQGTGFANSTLADFRYDMTELMTYAAHVWVQTDDVLKSLDPARLDEELNWSETWRLANLLTTGCLSHGWVHLGEIRQLRGLQGWKFRE